MRHKDTTLMEKIRAFAEEYFFEHGRSPSTTEIAGVVGISRGTAYKYLVEMNDRGMISYDGKTIVTEQTAKTEIALTQASVFRGAIPCGPPETIEASVSEYVRLPSAIFGIGSLYIIPAQGDSMIGAGIEDGDLVVIDRAASPNAGDIVVALDGEQQNTLKTLRFDESQSRYYLHPENSMLEDIYVDELSTQGVAQFVIKKLR